METNTITKSIDALSARIHFGELIKEVERGKTRFLVNRRGKPKMMIIGVEDYLKNVIKQSEILTTIQISAKKSGLDEMTDEEIDKEISDHRKSKLRK